MREIMVEMEDPRKPPVETKVSDSGTGMAAADIAFCEDEVEDNERFEEVVEVF